MPFGLETEMIPILKSNMSYLPKYSQLNRMAIAEELPVNHRIIDMVIAPIRVEYCDMINNNELKRIFGKLNMIELDVLSIFYQNKIVSIHKLKKQLKMQPDRIKQLYLNKFIDLELIIKISRYSYKTCEWVQFKPIYVLAIEAKLNKWNEALQQAIDNLCFADFSYVAMPADKDIKKTVISQFEQHNIGLIGVDDKGDIKLLYNPKKNRKYIESDYRLQRLRLYRDLICKNSKWYMAEF